MAQHRARFRLARRAAGVARRDAEGERPHPRAGRRGHSGARACVARRRGPRAGDDAEPRSSGCGRSARFPTTARSRRPPMPSSSTTLYGFLMREGAIPTDWFARQVEQADQDRRRHRHAVEPHRAYPHLDLRRQPARLARRSRALAGRHARGRGQAVRCAARAADRALRRSPHQRADAAAAREHGARNRHQQDRRGRGRGPLPSAGSTASSSRPQPRPPARRRKALAGAAQKALAGEIDARADAARRRPPTSSSCWRPTAPSAGSAQPVGKLVAGEEVLKPRVRIIADEHLTGAPRDAVQARLDLWLKAHIEKLLGAAVPARRGRGRDRHRARRRLPAHRGARRARAAEGRRGRQGARPAGARGAAQIRRALRRLSHLSAGAAQAGAARAGDAALRAQARRRRRAKGLDAIAAACRERAHLDRGRQGGRPGALSRRRLSRLRRARGARRHSGAARRPHPPGAGLAAGRAGHQAAGRARRLRLHRRRRR